MGGRCLLAVHGSLDGENHLYNSEMSRDDHRGTLLGDGLARCHLRVSYRVCDENRTPNPEPQALLRCSARLAVGCRLHEVTSIKSSMRLLGQRINMNRPLSLIERVMKSHLQTRISPRASVQNLQRLISESSSSYIPAEMVSLVEKVAKEERDSKLTDEMYQEFTMDMASYVLQAVNRGKEKRDSSMTSEEVYNPDLLNLCMCICFVMLPNVLI